MKIQKVFLSFAASLHALATGKVAVHDLDSAIFCTTQAEVNGAEHIDDPLHNQALIALGKAKTEGRLVFQSGADINSRITFEAINAKLAQFQSAPLTGSKETRLFEIPLRCCVPSASDHSYQVFWAECPTPEKNWRQSWGAVPASVA